MRSQQASHFFAPARQPDGYTLLVYNNTTVKSELLRMTKIIKDAGIRAEMKSGG